MWLHDTTTVRPRLFGLMQRKWNSACQNPQVFNKNRFLVLAETLYQNHINTRINAVGTIRMIVDNWPAGTSILLRAGVSYVWL